MCEYKGSISNNTDISNPVDRSLKQIQMAGAKIGIDEGSNADSTRTAALLLKNRAVRVEQFRNGKFDIDDISWHILLDLMVSMDAKKPVAVPDLANKLDVARNIVLRYVEYLIGVELIDKNTNAESLERVPLKLTASGDALTRDILQKIGQEIVSL